LRCGPTGFGYQSVSVRWTNQCTQQCSVVTNQCTQSVNKGVDQSAYTTASVCGSTSVHNQMGTDQRTQSVSVCGPQLRAQSVSVCVGPTQYNHVSVYAGSSISTQSVSRVCGPTAHNQRRVRTNQCTFSVSVRDQSAYTISVSVGPISNNQCQCK
jgi:hypothetical protein